MKTKAVDAMEMKRQDTKQIYEETRDLSLDQELSS